ncbi:unnamed protein product [Gongylonema pulchrum]|uniref:Major facilitator superfamily (MFS) profile domain-containing protein n=1 Tax=Gongylonema pulchrum TaxID=637853 RepID=A0A3P7RMN9_9BILA|nr:unnamed protein product [Gongylonema pulchrum]
MMVSVGCIMGTGFGLMYCPAIVIVTMYFEKKRAMATGIAVCGAGVGTVLFAPISEALIKAFSWRTVFAVYAGEPCNFIRDLYHLFTELINL